MKSKSGKTSAHSEMEEHKVKKTDKTGRITRQVLSNELIYKRKIILDIKLTIFSKSLNFII